MTSGRPFASKLAERVCWKQPGEVALARCAWKMHISPVSVLAGSMGGGEAGGRSRGSRRSCAGRRLLGGLGVGDPGPDPPPAGCFFLAAEGLLADGTVHGPDAVLSPTVEAFLGGCGAVAEGVRVAATLRAAHVLTRVRAATSGVLLHRIAPVTCHERREHLLPHLMSRDMYVEEVQPFQECLPCHVSGGEGDFRSGGAWELKDGDFLGPFMLGFHLRCYLLLCVQIHQIVQPVANDGSLGSEVGW